jgi:uncharacterized protein (TIGR04255 family)
VPGSVSLELPTPSTARLARSPLSLVVCQVRHENNPAAYDAKRAVSIRDALEATLPVLEEQANQELNIAAGQVGIQALPGEISRGWRMSSEDRTWTAVMMPSFFSLETRNYKDWEDFRARLESFVRAVAEYTQPSMQQRVGLRFIDRMSHPDVNKPQDWKRWIDSSFLGPIAHKAFGPAVEATQQILQLNAGKGRSIIVRHGCFQDQESDGQWIYSVDHDCFVQPSKAFHVDDVMANVETLHTLALQVFQAVITPAMYQYLLEE